MPPRHTPKTQTVNKKKQRDSSHLQTQKQLTSNYPETFSFMQRKITGLNSNIRFLMFSHEYEKSKVFMVYGLLKNKNSLFS